MSAQSRPHDAPTTLETVLNYILGAGALLVFIYGMVRLAEWIVARFSL